MNLPMALGNLPIAANGLPLVPIGNDIWSPPTVEGGDFDFLEYVFEGLDNIYLFLLRDILYRGINKT